MSRFPVTALLLVLLAPIPGPAALSPGDFAITHLAGGLVTVSDAATRGRGGVRTAAMDLLSPDLADPTGSSLAQLSALPEPLVYGEYGHLSGPQADTLYRSYRLAAPLSDRDAVLVHRLAMDGWGSLPVAPGTTGAVRLRERALAVWYGRREAGFAWGFGLAPQLQTHTAVRVAGNETAVIDSRTLLRFPRGRFSFYKKVNDRVRLGADSDLFDEHSTLRTAAGTVEGGYSSRLYRVGASCLLDADTVVGADFEWGTFRGPGKAMSLHDLYAGVERRLAPGLVLRAGSYDGRLTLGAGCRQGSTRLDAAWVAGVAADCAPLCGCNPQLWAFSASWTP